MFIKYKLVLSAIKTECVLDKLGRINNFTYSPYVIFSPKNNLIRIITVFGYLHICCEMFLNLSTYTNRF